MALVTFGLAAPTFTVTVVLVTINSILALAVTEAWGTGLKSGISVMHVPYMCVPSVIPVIPCATELVPPAAIAPNTPKGANDIT